MKLIKSTPSSTCQSGMMPFLRIILLFFMVLLISSCSSRITLKAFSPYTPTKVEKEANLVIPVEGNIQRSKSVSINYAVLYQLATATNTDDRNLTLNLFPFTNIKIELDEPVFLHENAYTQSGRVSNEPLSEVTIAVNGETVSMNIRCAKGIFYVRNVGQYHVVYEMDESYLSGETNTSQDLDQHELDSPLTATPQIDMLVIYSTAAKTAAGGTANIQNLIYLAAAEVNQGFENSGINTRVSLIHTQEVSTEPSTYPGGLYCVTEPADGCLDTIAALRDQYYADIVLYVINNNTYCGLSWMITNFNEYSEQSAFALVNWRCAADQYGMAREIGHLLGAQMDRSSAGYDQGAYTYSYGYQAPNNSFRTIMAQDCTASSCTRINYWSNPDISINGIPTGIIYTASNAADNRRTINHTAEWVSDFRIPPSPPDQVTILTPENGSIHSTSPVVFAWLPEPNASDYYLIIKKRDTNEVVQETIINGESYCTNTLCSYSPTFTLSPEDYKWQMAGINSIGTGEFSTYNNFYVQLQPPTLQSPVTGTGMYNTRPAFTWEKLANSTSYQIQLLTESGTVIFSTDVTSSSACSTDTCLYTAPEDLANGDYKWHVRGKKTVYGLWSSYNRFSILTLSAPSLLTPQQNSILYHRHPELTWSAVNGADSYQVALTRSSDGTVISEMINAGTACSAGTCSYTPVSSLIFDTYLWKIRGYTESTPGYWSQERTMTLSRLPAPVLVSPTDTQELVDRQPTFTWKTVSGTTVDHYELQVRDNLTGTLIATMVKDASQCSLNSCSITQSTALSDGSYKWHVRAWTTEDYGYWSTYWRFTTSLLPPTPQLRSPGNSSVIYGNRPTFKWYPLENVTSYRVHLENNTGSVIGEWQVGLTSCENTTYCEFRIPKTLPAYGTYRWKVQSIQNGVNSNWSGIYTFTYQQLAKTVLISPASGSTLSQSTPAFRWNTVTGPTYYQFQIRDMNDSIIIFDLVPAASCDASTCTYSPDVVLPDGEYKWHARAKNGINYAQWTPYWTFTIQANSVLEFNFNGNAPGWVDTKEHWSFFNNVYYRGEPGSQTFFNAITYYDQVYTDTTMTAQIRSVGAYGTDGFSLVLRSDFSDTGAILRGYTIDIEGTDTGIKISGWRVSTSSALTSPSFDKPTAVEISGIDIGLFHIYTLQVSGNEAYLLVDGNLVYAMPIDPLYTSGNFGFDVISPHTSNHSVDINWVSFTYP